MMKNLFLRIIIASPQLKEQKIFIYLDELFKYTGSDKVTSLSLVYTTTVVMHGIKFGDTNGKTLRRQYGCALTYR